MIDIDASVLERRRKKTVKARKLANKHSYFCGVAEARYVLRKVFRLVEEQAKIAGIDPLAHQALIQIYGSANSRLCGKEIAERLDITPAFASSLVKLLVDKGYVTREDDSSDGRISWVSVTDSGRNLLHRIDDEVQIHVDYFTFGLTHAERESALSILLFYVGVSLNAG